MKWKHGKTMSKYPYMIPNLHACDEKCPKQLSPDFYFRVDENIKRSRFITSLGHANTKENAKLFIDKIREEFSDASHNCWAFALGAPKDTANIGQSDDGEPHGTAGKPMLNMLLHGEIGECVVVVTRYFGGIKLGPGGLMRAYQGAVANVLGQAQIIEKIVFEELTIQCEYEHINKIHHLIPQFDAKIIDEVFDSNIRYVLRLPNYQCTPFKDVLMDVGNGRIIFLK